MNRDSAINVAKALAAEDTASGKPFVFLSASDTIFPFLEKYSQMKRQAENFLLTDEACQKNLNPVILRPGLIWHPKERQWLLPVKAITDVGFCLN